MDIEASTPSNSDAPHKVQIIASNDEPDLSRNEILHKIVEK